MRPKKAAEEKAASEKKAKEQANKKKAELTKMRKRFRKACRNGRAGEFTEEDVDTICEGGNISIMQGLLAVLNAHPDTPLSEEEQAKAKSMFQNALTGRVDEEAEKKAEAEANLAKAKLEQRKAQEEREKNLKTVG